MALDLLRLTLPMNPLSVTRISLCWVLLSFAPSVLTVRAASVIAWGNNQYGQTNVPTDLDVSIVAAGPAAQHALAIRPDGTVVAWGRNSTGQTNVPAGLSNVVAVSAGAGHSLALKSDGSVVAWGWNAYGQTNISMLTNGVQAIAAGAIHSLALLVNGTVVGYGDNTNGQRQPPNGLGTCTAIAAGSYHSMALRTDGTVVAWGLNDSGQTNVPAGLSNVIKIAAGRYFGMALRSNGSLVRWGGQGSSGPYGANAQSDIAAGAGHGLSMIPNLRAYVWGDNSSGQTNSPAGALFPDIVGVAAGQDFSMTLKGNSPPSIFSQPANQTVAVGYSVTISVGANGPAGLAYQWYQNSSPLPGRTSASMLITNVQTSNAGDYFVVITNIFGSVTSQVATLSVLEAAPSITIQPQNRTVTVASNVTFTVAASGALPMSIRWYFNDVFTGVTNAFGTTNSTFSRNPAMPMHAGNYYAVITNTYGTVTSSIATLTVTGAAPVIVVQPQSQTVTPPTNATFTLSVTASPTPSYQWLFNNAPIWARTQPTLTITNVDASHAGGYSVVVSNPLGVVTSAVAQLTINIPPGAPLVAPAHSLALVYGINGASLTFIGDPFSVYTLQASENLVNWTTVGSVVADATGKCDYDDLESLDYTSRYYRVLPP